MIDSRRAALERESFGPMAAIRRQFPGWHPWRSDAGRCWATRVGTGRPPPGGAMTVDGDTPAQLRAAIEAEEDRAVPG